MAALATPAKAAVSNAVVTVVLAVAMLSVPSVVVPTAGRFAQVRVLSPQVAPGVARTVCWAADPALARLVVVSVRAAPTSV